jgi:aminoglycoside 3-N-acetyltransferase
MSVKATLRRLLPAGVRSFVGRSMRSGRVRRVRSQVRVWRLRSSRDEVTREQLVSDLRALGLENGHRAVVHASLSGLGYVDGGASTVVSALLEVVGPDGLIAMPCHPVTGGTEAAVNSMVFDVEATPCSTGKIAEALRNWPGAFRSAHPTHSVAAYGAEAEEFVRDHHEDPTPFGAKSPYAKLMSMDGQIIGLGLDTRWFTFYHHFEDACQDFPISVYTPNSYSVRVRHPDGSEFLVATPRHDLSVSLARLNNVEARLAIVDQALTEWSGIRRASVGHGPGTIVPARGVYQTLSVMLKERGQTIYCPTELARERPDLANALRSLEVARR